MTEAEYRQTQIENLQKNLGHYINVAFYSFTHLLKWNFGNCEIEIREDSSLRKSVVRTFRGLTLVCISLLTLTNLIKLCRGQLDGLKPETWYFVTLTLTAGLGEVFQWHNFGKTELFKHLINCYMYLLIQTEKSLFDQPIRNSRRVNLILLGLICVTWIFPILNMSYYLIYCDTHFLAQILPICKTQTPFLSQPWNHLSVSLIPPLAFLQFFLWNQTLTSAPLVFGTCFMHPIILDILKRLFSENRKRSEKDNEKWISNYKQFTLAMNFESEIFSPVIFPISIGVMSFQIICSMYILIRLQSLSLVVTAFAYLIFIGNFISLLIFIKPLCHIPTTTKSLLESKKRNTLTSGTGRIELGMFLRSLRTMRMNSGTFGFFDEGTLTNFFMIALSNLFTILVAYPPIVSRF